MKTTLLLIALAGVVVIFLSTRYNRLVSFFNRFKNAFSQIDVQLRRRYDLIPNLVETARGYLEHERETLEAVILARNAASSAATAAAADPTSPSGISALSGADSALTSALGRLFAVVEAYPDLKANQSMALLMEELTTTENKIAFARQSYNDSVMVYNTARSQIPDVVFAGILGFGPAQLFETEDKRERESPRVSF